MTSVAWAVITTVTALGWTLHRLALAHLAHDPLDDEHRHLLVHHRRQETDDR